MSKMGFWSDGLSTEPKRKYTWFMLIGGIPQWIIKKTSKPSFTIEGAEHQYINHTFKYPGRVKFEDITVTLVDPITPDAAKTMENILRASGYNFPRDANDLTTISKAAAISALGNVAIIQHDAAGNEMERWELTNAWVKSVKFGELDYTSDDLVEIELVLTYDFAQIVTPEVGGIPAANA